MYKIGYLLLNMGVYSMLTVLIILALIHVQGGIRLLVRTIIICSIMIAIGTIMVNGS